jgi:hypothetical protein
LVGKSESYLKKSPHERDLQTNPSESVQGGNSVRDETIEEAAGSQITLEKVPTDYPPGGGSKNADAGRTLRVLELAPAFLCSGP